MRNEVYAVVLACHHRRTPWYAKALALCVADYALSPIDLIPDFIPVLGYLDDLVLLPLGIALVLRLIPADVMEECRRHAASSKLSVRGRWIVGGLIVCLWLLAAAWLVWAIRGLWFTAR